MSYVFKICLFQRPICARWESGTRATAYNSAMQFAGRTGTWQGHVCIAQTLVEINPFLELYMAAKNNCIKRDVCIFAKESFCSSNGECGHYIMEKGFTSTNKPMPKLPTLEESLHKLHDSDWGWVDSQSYWYGARSMYNRISRQLSANDQKRSVRFINRILCGF